MLPAKLKKRLFSDVSLRTLRYVHPVPPARARGLLRRIYERIDDDFLLGGPLVVHSQTPVLMAGMWVFGREANLVSTALDRTTKEAIATAVAVSNRCPYCVDMHATLTHAGRRHEVASAIRGNGRVDDPYWQSVTDWALSTREPDAPILRAPPFTHEQLPEAVGNAVFFHYVNRVVNVLFEGSALGDDGFAKGFMLRTFGAELRHDIARPLEPARDLDLLPGAALPGAFAWAEGQPNVAEAAARWDAALEHDTDLALDPSMKARIETVLRDWRGEDPPLSRGWVVPHLSELDAAQEAVVKLALLTALDSHRVVEADVRNVQEIGGDELLLRTVAWGAFAAARRIGEWLHP